MSKLYTSYFARIKDLPDNVVPISICGKAPEGYKGLQYKVLAPRWSFFSKWVASHNNDYFIKEYKEQVLDKVSMGKVLMDLIDMINKDKSKDICLVCYEKPNDFCHRHLVAEWFCSRDIKCVEYDFSNNEDK